MHSAISPQLPQTPGQELARRELVAGAIALALAALSGPAGAAQQGEIAAGSRGSLGISASVAARTQIAGVMDAALVPVGSSGTATALQRICIRSNSATLRYDITASGTAAGDSFVLTGADGAIVPLTLAWTDVAAGPAALLPGVPLRGLTASRQACSVARGSILAVAAPVSRAPVEGAITLTISPL